MSSIAFRAGVVLALLAGTAFPVSLPAATPTYVDPAKTDDDYPFIGEFAGACTVDGKPVPYGVQINALGKKKFLVSITRGGLPGAGWDESKREKKEVEREGQAIAGTWSLGKFSATPAAFTVFPKEGAEVVWKRVDRVSPTLGAKPPENAVVLFDGTSMDAFETGKMTKDGLLQEDAVTKKLYQNFKLHLEFRTPYKPEARGQDRGNSGVYMQRKYECQILDAFALEESIDNTGAVYSIHPALVNACLPPLVWQTYDIEYHNGEYAPDGEVKTWPKVTAVLNGVVVQKDTELKKQSRWAAVKAGPHPGPIWFQGHGNPVRFRNIWLVELP